MSQNIVSAGLTYFVAVGGHAVQIATPDMGDSGGVIYNPLREVDQGIHFAEPLFIDVTGNQAALISTGTTVQIMPGQSYITPPNSTVWVNSNTSGHKFTSYFVSPFEVQYPPHPIFSEFPPPGVTGLTTVIPSYLYQEYTDDDDLQGYVAAQNEMQQNYVDTFNALNLPIYPGPIVSGKLLDWVGRGVYGMQRPALSSGIKVLFGPLNTWGPNWVTTDVQWQGPYDVKNNNPDLTKITIASDWMFWTAVTPTLGGTQALTVNLPGLPIGTIIHDRDEFRYFADPYPNWEVTSGAAVQTRFALNEIVRIGPEDAVLTSDDVYRRILTWHFYKGDGNYLSIRWLKRRVWRFIYGKNGWGPSYAFDPLLGAPHSDYADPDDVFISDTKQISITLGVENSVCIRFVLGKRTVTGGLIMNEFGCNGFGPSVGALTPDNKVMPLNDLESIHEIYPQLPLMKVFKEAIDCGVLEIPYQFKPTVHIG